MSQTHAFVLGESLRTPGGGGTDYHTVSFLGTRGTEIEPSNPNAFVNFNPAYVGKGQHLPVEINYIRSDNDPTLILDCQKANNFHVTLGGAYYDEVLLVNPVKGQSGQIIVELGAGFIFPDGASSEIKWYSVNDPANNRTRDNFEFQVHNNDLPEDSRPVDRFIVGYGSAIPLSDNGKFHEFKSINTVYEAYWSTGDTFSTQSTPSRGSQIPGAIDIYSYYVYAPDKVLVVLSGGYSSSASPTP